MTYRPMLFNTPMVCAIEDGTKTQTRRLVQLPKNKDWELLDVHPNPDLPGRFWQAEINGALTDVKKRFTLGIKAPCVAGDVLWVRETWRLSEIKCDGGAEFFYFADGLSDASAKTKTGRMRWRPSIHMPKEAARIFLQVDEVRAERLQFITEDDAMHEGAAPEPPFIVGPYVRGFISAWESTIPKGKILKCGWDANPWVWVISFTRMGRPEGWQNVRQ